jgi:hypothetical protein
VAVLKGVPSSSAAPKARIAELEAQLARERKLSAALEAQLAKALAELARERKRREAAEVTANAKGRRLGKTTVANGCIRRLMGPMVEVVHDLDNCDPRALSDEDRGEITRAVYQCTNEYMLAVQNMNQRGGEDGREPGP